MNSTIIKERMIHRMRKKEIRRNLRAIDIAKVLFWMEGYHTDYLKSIETILKDLIKKRP